MPDTIPANAGFMIAAYIVTGAVMLAYAVVLWRRGSTLRR